MEVGETGVSLPFVQPFGKSSAEMESLGIFAQSSNPTLNLSHSQSGISCLAYILSARTMDSSLHFPPTTSSPSIIILFPNSHNSHNNHFTIYNIPATM